MLSQLPPIILKTAQLSSLREQWAAKVKFRLPNHLTSSTNALLAGSESFLNYEYTERLTPFLMLTYTKFKAGYGKDKPHI